MYCRKNDKLEYIHAQLVNGKKEIEKVNVLNQNYGFKESIHDLEKFIDKYIHYEKEHWRRKIENFKKEKSISMRNVNVELSEYWQKYNGTENINYTEEEHEMLEDLMHFWG